MQLQVNDVLDFALKLAEALKIPAPDHAKVFINHCYLPDAQVNWCQPLRIHWEVDPRTVDIRQEVPIVRVNWQQVGLHVGLSRDFTTGEDSPGILYHKPLRYVDFVISFTPLPIGWNPQCVAVERVTP